MSFLSSVLPISLVNLGYTRSSLEEEKGKTIQEWADFLQSHTLDSISAKEKEKLKTSFAKTIQEGEHLQGLFKELWTEKAIRDKPKLQHLLANLEEILNEEQIEKFIYYQFKKTHENFFLEEREKLKDILEEDYTVKKSWKQHVIATWNRDWPILIQSTANLINLFIDTLDFLNFNRTNISLWDRQVIFFIIARFLAVPALLVQALSPFVGTTSKVYMVAYTLLTAISAALYIYQRWIRCKVGELPEAENMNDQAMKGEFEEIVIDEARLKRATDLLNRILIIIAEPGEGKTTVVESIVKRAQQEKKLSNEKDKILPFKLRDREFFRIKGDAFQKGYNKLQDPMHQIQQKIKGYESHTAFFFDELDPLLEKGEGKSRLGTLNYTLKSPDLVSILAFTPGQWATISKEFDIEQAFSSRCSILELPPASSSEIQMMLLKKYQITRAKIFQKTGIHIFIEKGAFEAIVEEAKKTFRDAIPRRSVHCLEKLISRCQEAYQETYFIKELDQFKADEALEKELSKAYRDRNLLIRNPEREKEIQRLTSLLKKQKQAAKFIQYLKSLEFELMRACQEATQSWSSKLKIRYVIYKSLGDFLTQTIEEEINKWRSSGEMNLRIDSELIKEYFKKEKESQEALEKKEKEKEKESTKPPSNHGDESTDRTPSS